MYISHTRHIIGHVLRIKPKIVKCASLIQSTLHIIKDDDSTELLHICPLALPQSKIFHQGWFISGMRFCWEANGQKGAGDTQCCSVPQTCGSGEGSSVKVNCDTAVSSNQWKQCGRTLELGIVGHVCFVFLVSALSLAHLNNALKAGILENRKCKFIFGVCIDSTP